MACYRCVVVITRDRETPQEPVGVCRTCGSMACDRDGELDRDYPQFICGMCEPGRLSSSGGLPPHEPPGPRGGGGGVGGPDPLPQPVGPGGGGAAYADSADFERRRPRIAAASYAHRTAWKQDIERTVEDLKRLAVDERTRALIAAHLGDEFDPETVRQTAVLLGNQLEAASEQGTLMHDLLADAFGVAAWSIGAQPREEPTSYQLVHLSDPRLRVVLGYSAIQVTT
jgi:hypothetical protein